MNKTKCWVIAAKEFTYSEGIYLYKEPVECDYCKLEKNKFCKDAKLSTKKEATKKLKEIWRMLNEK